MTPTGNSPARTRANGSGTPSTHAASSIAETVRTFLRLLERGDIDAWMDLWAEDADHYYPYGTEVFPPHLVGKAAIHERWKNTPAMFERMSYPIREIFTDGDTAIARFDSDSVLKSGETYLNHYICVFKFDPHGKLAEYWEYFDPILAGAAFGLVEVTYPGLAGPSAIQPADSGPAPQPTSSVQVPTGGGRMRVTVSIDVDPSPGS